ncbi:MAG: nitrate ABC transporter substrate-binding protein, partial [Bradyrhizobium sp.]|nr:nitrate ABC transporter substrate-binding protein [Bradyrhizobium sp.]
CAVDANGTEMVLPLRSSSERAGESLGTTMPLPLKAKDAASGAEITDVSRVAQIWLKDEPQVRHYASPEAALKALVALEKDGKTARVVYAQDRESGIKLFASQAWFVRSSSGELSAFLLKEGAERWAKAKGGDVVDFAAARDALVASR